LEAGTSYDLAWSGAPGGGKISPHANCSSFCGDVSLGGI